MPILNCDVRAGLAQLPEKSVQCGELMVWFFVQLKFAELDEKVLGCLCIIGRQGLKMRLAKVPSGWSQGMPQCVKLNTQLGLRLTSLKVRQYDFEQRDGFLVTKAETPNGLSPAFGRLMNQLCFRKKPIDEINWASRHHAQFAANDIGWVPAPWPHLPLDADMKLGIHHSSEISDMPLFHGCHYTTV